MRWKSISLLARRIPDVEYNEQPRALLPACHYAVLWSSLKHVDPPWILFNDGR